MMKNEQGVVDTTRTYYNSDDADNFYAAVWGGEDIHIGLYHSPDDTIFEASRRTVEKMASTIPELNNRKTVIDIGSGYGGSARYLAGAFGCHVECLNLSEVQNERNRNMNREQNLSDLIGVTDGDFENLPYGDERFDVAWSQDAILHAGNRQRVFAEAARVLKPRGRFVYTDIMQSDDCPSGVLQPVLDRIHLESLASPSFYRRTAADLGFVEIVFEELTDQLANHYQRVHDAIKKRYEEILKICSAEYIDRMLVGLQHWVSAGKSGHLKWGIFHFQKK